MHDLDNIKVCDWTLQDIEDCHLLFCISVVLLMANFKVDTCIEKKMNNFWHDLGDRKICDVMLQEHGCHSKAACDLVHSLVEDYCVLFPEVSQTFQNLPKISPLFTCNFITAVATIYPFDGNGKERYTVYRGIFAPFLFLPLCISKILIIQQHWAPHEKKLFQNKALK